MSKTPPPEGRMVMMSTRVASKTEKEYKGRLPFRTTPDIHQRIAEAAKHQNSKSINAWMEKTLLEAANEALGLEEETNNVEISSEAIRRLLNDTDEQTAERVGQLITDILAHLEKGDPLTIIRFNSALKKLLIGIDAVRSLSPGLAEKDLTGLLAENCPCQTLDALMVSVLGVLLNHDDGVDITHFTLALKRLALGLKAIHPMVKQENCSFHLSRIFQKVDEVIRQVEAAT